VAVSEGNEPAERDACACGGPPELGDASKPDAYRDGWYDGWAHGYQDGRKRWERDPGEPDETAA
jgi:hypothetical protein